MSEVTGSAIRMHFDKLVHSLRRFRMGGSNQATCPPAPSSAKPRKTSKSTPTSIGTALNPIRFHEVPSRGEVDFHDDKAGLKCAIDSAAFFDTYGKWRPSMTDDLTLGGNDGSGGHSSVTFLPYVDDQGTMQVSMIVAEAEMGKTVLDLDTLAHYS